MGFCPSWSSSSAAFFICSVEIAIVKSLFVCCSINNTITTYYNKFSTVLLFTPNPSLKRLPCRQLHGGKKSPVHTDRAQQTSVKGIKMHDNQSDSDNQTQQLKVWRMQPEKCKHISYFLTVMNIFYFLKALPSGYQGPILFCNSVAARWMSVKVSVKGRGVSACRRHHNRRRVTHSRDRQWSRTVSQRAAARRYNPACSSFSAFRH